MMKETAENKTTDRGWAAMRPVLDREMPVRRRRFLAFWWLLGLLVLGIAWRLVDHPDAGFLPPKALSPAVSTPSVPIAALPRPDAQKSALNTEKKAQAPAPEKNPATKSYRVPAGRTATALPSSSGAPKIEKETEGVLPLQANAEQQTVVLNLIAEKEGKAPTEPSSIAAQPLLPVPDPPLVFLPVAMPALPSIDIASPSAPTKPVSTPAAWTLGAQAAMVSDFRSINGFTGGLTADWQPLRRWGLRFGLGYRYEQPRQSQRPLALVPRTEYVGASKNTTGSFANFYDTSGVSAGLSGAPVVVPATRLHYVEVPVLAYWQASPKWRLYGGVAADFLVGSRASEEYSADNSAFQTYSLDARQVKTLSRTVRENLPGQQIDGCLGAAFRLGRRLEIEALYRFGGKWNGPSSQESATPSTGAADQFDNIGAANKAWRQRLQLGVGVFF